MEDFSIALDFKIYIANPNKNFLQFNILREFSV